MIRNHSFNNGPKVPLPTRISSNLRRWTVFAAAIAVFVAVFISSARCEEFAEYKVKAVFLYNLANFVEWPDRAFGSKNDPFTIGILGADPFGSQLDRTVADETVRGRKIEIKRYRDLSDFDAPFCQMLFVNIQEKETLAALNQKLEGAPVLTVSDQPTFARKHGMVNLLAAGNRILLEINMDNAHRSGIKISSKLLHLASLVNSLQKPKH